MTLLTTGPTFSDPVEELLQKLENRIDAVVEDAALHAYDIQKHEEPLTSRLAQAIYSELRGAVIEVPGLKVEVHAEEFSRVQERRTGADLYISLVRLDYDIPVSKGILVQAKRRSSLINEEESRRLGNQAKRMYRRSKSSYVWIYDSNGVSCAKAPQSSRPTLTRITNPLSVGKLIADGLRCRLGDERIGRDPSVSVTQGISSVMNRLSIRGGLDFAVQPSWLPGRL
jgi:hypothetical protein